MVHGVAVVYGSNVIAKVMLWRHGSGRDFSSLGTVGLFICQTRRKLSTWKSFFKKKNTLIFVVFLNLVGRKLWSSVLQEVAGNEVSWAERSSAGC